MIVELSNFCRKRIAEDEKGVGLKEITLFQIKKDL